MREILFRGKKLYDGKWAESVCPVGTMVSGQLVCDFDPFTVGQYTGLKDKNGKRIFEGDIIKYAYNLDYNCFLESVERPEDYEGCDYSDIFTIDKVVYCDEIDYPAFDLDKHNFDCNGLSELVVSMEYHYEVIGNIHDNPELLGDNNG